MLVAVPALCFIVPIVARASDTCAKKGPLTSCHLVDQGLPLGVPEGVTVPRARLAQNNWSFKVCNVQHVAPQM